MRLFLVIMLAISTRANAQPSSNGQAETRNLSVAEMRDDIAAFRTEFMARDNSFSTAARAQAEAELKDLERALDGLNLVAFELKLSRIVALADNGHTMAAPFVRARQFNRVPVRLIPFGTEFRVLRTANASADLLGARLTAIDGHPVSQLIDSARTLAGGTSRWRDRTASILLESPEQLHAMGLATNVVSATYSFLDAKGQKIDRELTGEHVDPSAPRVQAQRLLLPALLAEEEGKWRTALDPSKAPWSLAEPDARFRWRAAPELDALVIELRQVISSPGYSITEFLSEMTTKLQARRPNNLVIDMRLNSGGNLQTARDFMKTLPILVPGRIFVLTSPWTFSAAISSVGYLEQMAPDRVTIVGEEVGDRLEFWAEGTGATLPHSGMVMLYATQRHDYRNGCRTFTDCHGAVVQYPIAVPSLAPDIQAPWTFEAYRAGRDPAMEAVATALRAKS
jgi:hypothetical protein